MTLKYIPTLLVSLLLLCSCDDEITNFGSEMMPTSDLMEKSYATYDVGTSSYAVGDKVLARTSLAYLGQFTDPETGSTVKSDFMAQFHCNENFSLPDKIVGDTCTSVDLRLFISDFVGDSLATFKISLYELTKSLDSEADYYTNINPADYCDMNAKPMATKWFTISDHTVSDSLRNTSSYLNNIRITLPNEIGNKIISSYRSNPELFKNASTWLNSGLPGSKGFYFKLESGDGAISYIDVTQLNLYFNYYDEEYEADTLGVCQFAATEEVVVATRFENSGIEKLIENEECTYLKTPAGVFTMATIPADMINANDTINSAKITFTRYNDLTESNFKIGIPQTLLMVRLDDYLNGYFEKYSKPDNVTSYLTTFNSSRNSYTYYNIARLVKTMANEKKNGTATDNWNKVLLIPVQQTTSSSTGGTVKINHDFSICGTRLVGGKKGEKVQLEVIYSRFNVSIRRSTRCGYCSVVVPLQPQ